MLAHQPGQLDELTLDDFLGTKRLTHAYAGRSGMIGLDDMLYRFIGANNDNPNCPEDKSYNSDRYGYNRRQHYCNSSRLAEIKPMTQDEIETMNLVVEIKRYDRVLTFHKYRCFHQHQV